MQVVDANVAQTVGEALRRIQKGEAEVMLVPFSHPLDCHDLIPKTAKRNVASELEFYLVQNVELQEFFEHVYGQNWRLRPTPVFHSHAHTILTKNIGVHLGLTSKHKFYYTPNSSTDDVLHNAILKLKPNSSKNNANNLGCYNRYDGNVCQTYKCTHFVEYDATKFFVIYCPLLLIHKAKISKKYLVANICVDRSKHVAILENLEVAPIHDDDTVRRTIRGLDTFAAITNQVGFVNHHGMVHPSFLHDVHPTQFFAHIPTEQHRKMIALRYGPAVATKDEDNNHDTKLSGLYYPWPSFLYRKNWFVALGNKREQGAWIGACRFWITSDMQHQQFYLQTWVAPCYHNVKSLQNPGVSRQALARHQDKFILQNVSLWFQKLFLTCFSDDAYVPEPMLKHVQRRVKKNPTTIKKVVIVEPTVDDNWTKSLQWIRNIQENQQK